MKCRLYLNQDMYGNGEFNTIITKDGREIDYTHWEDENGNCKVSDKLVYEGENDFTVVHYGYKPEIDCIRKEI